MLKKLLFRPGINKENTRYTTEGGFYDCDKIRFRQGTPEKIGGWTRTSSYFFQGVCRSLWNWITLANQKLIGVGTNLKFYIYYGGQYSDITPIRRAASLSNPFVASNGSATITVTDANHGCITGDFVTFNGSASLGGNITDTILNAEFQVTVINSNTYTITSSVIANASDTGNGGVNVRAVYQINVGYDIAYPSSGWGSTPWGSGGWGTGLVNGSELRQWSQSNFGQDLIFGYRGSALYYWNAYSGTSPVTATITIAAPAVINSSDFFYDGTPIMFNTTGFLPTGLETGTIYYVKNYVAGSFNVSLTSGGAAINTSGTQSGTHSISNRAVPLASLTGASDVPIIQNFVFISNTYRFVFAFGCNDYGQTTQEPLLVRWSAQEDAANWTPAVTNQAGSISFSHGSKIVAAIETKQEILVSTDTCLYSMQYVGSPYVWSTNLIADNISIQSQNAMAIASGVVYWMGKNKFYRYSGVAQTLRCDLRQYIFNDFNALQSDQVFAGTNEAFNEVWWFYCSASSTVIDKYVVYNYGEDVWYYGSIGRTAWLDNAMDGKPVAATYSKNLVEHEEGIDDNETSQTRAIDAYITSSEFDIDDGHNFGFVWRILPDITFAGSSANNPQATMTLIPLKNSGSGYTNPQSVGGASYGDVTRTVKLPIEQFTGQINIRVRGRQMAFKVESNQIGCTWQLGAPRMDIKTDGQR